MGFEGWLSGNGVVLYRDDHGFRKSVIAEKAFSAGEAIFERW
jgi:hypothetical protein